MNAGKIDWWASYTLEKKACSQQRSLGFGLMLGHGEARVFAVLLKLNVGEERSRMRRRVWIMMVAGLLAGVTLGAERKPNILYINADDLGVMDVGYNNSLFNTPNIDQLAKDGMRFTTAYAPAANCAPSRACVHSGQWSARHGVYTVGNSDRGKAQTRKLIPIENGSFPQTGITTMAMALKAQGYTTIHLGKYHMGQDPLTLGYDVNIGGDKSGSPAGGYFSPWGKGSMKELGTTVPEATHRMDIYAREAVDFVAANKDKPMFIHFSPYLVHTPLQKVPEFFDNYKDKNVNAVYASMVEKFDQGVGKVLDALDAHGLRDNTLVVFSSDNGGIAGVQTQAPYRAGKGSYYEGGIREPLVMRWPGKIKAGSTCAEQVCTIDLYPTFLAAAGLAVPEGVKLDGVTLLPLMTQSGGLAERALFWHFPIYLQAYSMQKDDGRDPLFRTRPGSAMRSGKWKLHEYFEDGGLELYDLETDAGERKNLAASMPEKVSELKKVLDAWRSDTRSPVPTKLNPAYQPGAGKAKKKKR